MSETCQFVFHVYYEAQAWETGLNRQINKSEKADEIISFVSSP